MPGIFFFLNALNKHYFTVEDIILKKIYTYIKKKQGHRWECFTSKLQSNNNTSWGQCRLAPISSTGTSANTGFLRSPFPPGPQLSCSLPAATASPPRETEPGARPRAPRTEHKAGPCPSPTSNQHRPSSMRFNCLFIILAHRGYKEAWHFCARHPAEPWELSRLKKNNSQDKGDCLELNGFRSPWLSERARAQSVAAPRCLLCPFRFYLSGEESATKRWEFELTAPECTNVPFLPDCVLKVPGKSITSHGFTAKPRD